LELNFSLGTGSSYYVLVGASGTGKTRFLLEEASANFGLYFTTSMYPGLGIDDLYSFICYLPRVIEEVDEIRTKLMNRMSRVVLARIAVLQRAKEAFPDLTAFPWKIHKWYRNT
jgi:hypothetical protein